MCKMTKSESGKLGAIKTNELLIEKRVLVVEEYNSNPNICPNCEKPIEYGKRRNKFCSQSCSAGYNNKNRMKKDYGSCYCGEKLIRNNQKFCSTKCQRDSDYEHYIAEWKLGNRDGVRGEYGISLNIRRYLYDKYDSKCSCCGWCKVNQHTGNIPLEIEHIDGDYTNNDESNLTLLCPNCHSLTPTYKGANAGNGRKKRKKYN